MIPTGAQMSRIDERFLLSRAAAPLRGGGFADDVRIGFAKFHKALSARYLYDDLGSALFEAITYLPEYYLTAAEIEIFERYADEIIAAVGSPIALVELGSGTGRKTRLLIEATLAKQPRLTYQPIDISAGTLQASARALLHEYAALNIVGHAGDYFDVLGSGAFNCPEHVLALLLGSNIGNYTPAEATTLLRAIAGSLELGDALLLGADSRNDPAMILRAYDDPTGVSSAFAKNILGRINRELGGNFDLAAFAHVVEYDELRGCVKSYLQSQTSAVVMIDGLNLRVDLAAGERIHIESSYKFSAERIEELATACGLRLARAWTDPAGRFSANLLMR